MNRTTLINVACLTALLVMPAGAGAQSVGTAFLYQGQLAEDGQPVQDRVDFTFTLWNAETGGQRVGSPIAIAGVPVNQGLFTVELDFGEGVFASDSRWLEIAVNGTELTPRQPIKPTPYAMALPGLWTQQDATSPNLIGGGPNNTVRNSAIGATIGGGGSSDDPHTVYDDYATVAGGSGNIAGSGDGDPRSARGATVAGGSDNIASGMNAITVGGRENVADGTNSLAAGMRAHSNHDGTFVWSDSSVDPFESTGNDQFLINARGGVGVGTNDPSEALDVDGTVKARGFQLTSAPSAGYVLTSDASGVGSWQPGAGGSLWNVNGDNIYYDAGDVGIGLDSPQVPLHVASPDRTAIRGATSSGSDFAVRGERGPYYGGLGGQVYGVYGNSLDGFGVRGDSDYHWPVAGISPNATGVVGVVGAIKTEGDAMLWTSNSGVSGATQAGYGVAGRTIEGIGVYGTQDNSGNYGYLGTTLSGVYGEHDATGNYGRIGTTDEGVIGRYGGGEDQYGSLGRADTGVFGRGETGYGGYFYSNQGTAAKFANYNDDCVIIDHNAQATNTAALEIDSSGTGEPIGLSVIMDADFGKLARFDLNGAAGYLSPAFHVEAETSGNVAEFIGQYSGSSNPTIYAETIGTGNVIRAIHKRTTGNSPAIYGQHDESAGQGTGVEGVGGYRGVYGHVSAAGDGDHVGLWGSATGGVGTNYGIYAEASGGLVNLAGYFAGDVVCAGSLSKSGGTFMIDHPLDPENKYLYHSFVESPDMMNIYNGNVVLDERGEAVVTMPDWFEPLNRDFRYQLTCIGGFAQIYVAKEIANSQFMIAGGEPGLKVSWQVTGVRQDPYAEANRVQVEVDKPETERGTYLHPEAWGVSADLGLNQVRKAQMAQQETVSIEK